MYGAEAVIHVEVQFKSFKAQHLNLSGNSEEISFNLDQVEQVREQSFHKDGLLQK